jgi:hypothetical protein
MSIGDKVRNAIQNPKHDPDSYGSQVKAHFAEYEARSKGDVHTAPKMKTPSAPPLEAEGDGHGVGAMPEHGRASSSEEDH